MLQRLLAVLVTVVAGASTMAEPIYYFAPHGGLVERDSDEKSIPAGAPDLVVSQNGLTYNVYFTDIRVNSNVGFDSPTVGASARARFQEVLEYIADVLNETGTLDIVVEESQTDGSGALAFAGTFYSLTAGFQKGSTLQRLDSGVKPFAGTEEIGVTVDFGFQWNFGTGNPAANQADFSSVILHELTHGLGFASLANSTGASQISAGVYSLYDQLVRRNTGNVTLFSGTPPSFQGAAADLRSNDLGFAGAQADARYAPAARPGIFAPNPFQPGSSLSHWNTGNIVGGAVMEHAIVLGTQRREYEPLEIGALIDIGYTNAEDPFLGTPGNLSVSPNPGGGVNFGSVQIGNVANQNFTIQNTGGTAINGSASVTGGAPFSIVSGTPFTVNPSSSVNVQVRFTPSSAGAASRTLVISGDPDGAINITLNGTGTNAPTPGNLNTSPDISGGIDMGEVEAGSFSEFTFTLSNTGGTAIVGNATTTGAAFSVTQSNSYNLAGGANTTVRVQFSPGGEGDTSGTLRLTGDPDGDIVVNLFGTGLKGGNAACGVSKGQPGRWSTADALLVGLCGAVLVLSTRKAAQARARR